MNVISRIRHKFISVIRQIMSEIVKTELTINRMHKLSVRETEHGVSDNPVIDSSLIVSLTTYSDRIHDVYLTIESIMQQSQKANRIILWLDEEEFNNDNIPLILKKQSKRGLEIKYCKNLKSFKKIIPTLQIDFNATIITVDDDVIYPYDMIERMITAYNQNKKCIYFSRGRVIEKKHDSISDYGKWKMVTGNELRYDVLPTGIGGIFYPSGCFPKEVLNEDSFMKLCPRADDIWLRAMTLMNGYPCMKINYSGSFRYSFVNIDNNQGIALNKQNLWNNSNNKQFMDVFCKYKLFGKF